MTITEQATDELNKIGFRVNIKSKLKQWLCEDCEMKQWTYLENEVERGNIKHDPILVGVPWAYIEVTEDEIYEMEEIQR